MAFALSSSRSTTVALLSPSTRFSNLPPRTLVNQVQVQLENSPSPSAHETMSLISSNSTATTPSSVRATLPIINMNMQKINFTAGFSIMQTLASAHFILAEQSWRSLYSVVFTMLLRVNSVYSCCLKEVNTIKLIVA